MRFGRMWFVRLAGLIFAMVVVAGCGTKPVLQPVGLSGKSAAKSLDGGNRSLAIVVSTGSVTGGPVTTYMPIGTAPGVMVPLQSGPRASLAFNAQDQQVFAKSLGAALRKLNVEATVASDTGSLQSEFVAHVIFARTFNDPGLHDYFLDVVIDVHGGPKPLLKQYRIDSSEGESIWSRMGTNAQQGKEKAAQKLIDALVPDLINYLSQNES